MLFACESWAPPATNADAFEVLVTNAVLGDELAERLARAG